MSSRISPQERIKQILRLTRSQNHIYSHKLSPNHTQFNDQGICAQNWTYLNQNETNTRTSHKLKQYLHFSTSYAHYQSCIRMWKITKPKHICLKRKKNQISKIKEKEKFSFPKHV